jgi:ribonuclease HII
MRGFIVGVDEAGRGPLAGPVAAGVVLVPARYNLRKQFPGLDDSKKLSAKKREKLFEILKGKAIRGELRFCVCYSSHATIDRLGITRAVKRAVWNGVRKLALEPNNVRVLLDGLLLAPPEYAQKTIIHGDALEPAISLASIAAKVSRDRLMCRLAKKYPEYGFEIHKGYGTKAHYVALKRHGLCKIHRTTFIKKV